MIDAVVAWARIAPSDAVTEELVGTAVSDLVLARPCGCF
jgi:hypothetical protein